MQLNNMVYAVFADQWTHVALHSTIKEACSQQQWYGSYLCNCTNASTSTGSCGGLPVKFQNSDNVITKEAALHFLKHASCLTVLLKPERQCCWRSGPAAILHASMASNRLRLLKKLISASNITEYLNCAIDGQHFDPNAWPSGVLLQQHSWTHGIAALQKGLHLYLG